MKPAPGEDEENQQDADAAEGDAIARPESKEGTGRNTPGSKKEDGEEEAEGEQEEKAEVLKFDVIENDHIEKANMLPPLDPEGENTMVADLQVSKERLLEVLEKALQTVCNWLIQEKNVYNLKAKSEGKQLKTIKRKI